MKYFALLTKLGENLLAQATALGTKLELTHMAVGDGGGKLPTPDTHQTKLIAEKRRAAINTLFIDDKNKNQIIAEQIIPEAEGGWWIREIGLFDKTGNLIAVANCPETYKPQLAEGSGRTQAIRMILVVSHTESVTLKIDPSVVLATRKYVDDLITALDIKLQKQIDNKVNKAGDSVTGTLKFNGIAPLTYDIESLTGNKVEIANYLRRFRYLYNSTIFHEIVTKDGIQIATGTEPTNLIYSLSSTGSLTLKGRVIPTDFLDFNQRYLGINNPAIAAKKLDKPSRIAGHTFQGQGEDIKITPADIGAQPVGSYAPAGDYATNTALKNELSKKFDKSGGNLTGYLTAMGSVTAKFGNDDKIAAQLNIVNNEIALRAMRNGVWNNSIIPAKNGTLMHVGDFGVGKNSGVTLAQSGVVVSDYRINGPAYCYGGANPDTYNKGNHTLFNIFGHASGNYGAQLAFPISGKNDFGFQLINNNVVLGWCTLYHTDNTTVDRNGNLKVVGASNALSDCPVGSPIPWPQAAAPAGFLICNGQTFNKTTYPLLATAYPSGKLPDLRGEFIRGLDAGRNIDNGRAVLSAQGDAIRDITGEIQGMNMSGSGAFGDRTTVARAMSPNGSGKDQFKLLLKASNVVPTASENRPRNIAFLYIVRAA